MKTLREEIPLKKIKIIKKTISGYLPALFGILILYLIIFAIIGQLADEEILGLMFLMGFVVIFITLPVFLYLYNKQYFKNYFYDMNEQYITIRKGVFGRKEATLPFSKITDVYIDQDILDRIFKLYDFHISTPTEKSGDFAHIDGISKDCSEKLKRKILDKIISKN